MMFTAVWTSYVFRLQMPILAVPMIVPSQPSGQAASGACKQPDPVKSSIASLNEESNYSTPASGKKVHRDDEPFSLKMISNEQFTWSAEMRGQLLSAYSLGSIPGNLLGGILSIKLGSRQTILWSTLLSVVLGLLSPPASHLSFYLLLMFRVLTGLLGGLVFPACHGLVAKWAPPTEKSRFVWSLQGGAFGTIFTYPFIADLAERYGWEIGWYVPSIIIAVWLVFWMILAYDSPAEHPRISDEERNFIVSSQAGVVKAQSPSFSEIPLLAIMTSVPFISLVVLHMGNLFLVLFFQNSMMLYLTNALGFKLQKGGILASMPWAARFFFGFFFSWAGDIVKRKEYVSVTIFRKCATIFSHFLPAIFLILVGYVGCDLTLANVFLFFALGFNGAACIANLTNNQDLSPNYAGFLYGIMNTIGSATGMIVPWMVEEIAGKHGNTIDRWQTVFWIGGIFIIGTVVVYVLGGSGEVQSWNEPKNR